MNRRCVARKFPLAAMIAVAVTGFSSAALAHAGDHSHMTFSGMANHLSSHLDHVVALMAAILVIALVGASVLPARRKGPENSPEKSAT